MSEVSFEMHDYVSFLKLEKSATTKLRECPSLDTFKKYFLYKCN